MLQTEEEPQTRDTTQSTGHESTPSITVPSSPDTDRAPSHGDGLAAQGDGHASSAEAGWTLPSSEEEPLQTPTHRRPWKKPGNDLRASYSITMQVGFILSLLLLFGLTQLQFETDQELSVQLEEQDVVQMEEVKQTEQQTAPPPPPRPATPIEVPDNTIVESQDLDFDASLDLNESLDTGAPPPETEAPPPETENEPEDEIFVVVEDDPVLIGGLRGLQEKIEYPAMARNAGIEGRVIVQFIVDENGDVTNPTVIRGRHPSLDEEALRVIRHAQFEPGRQRGNPVKVQMALPITFKLAKRSQ